MLGIGHAFAQNKSKPVLDTNAVNNWQLLRNGELSPDGKFAAFEIHKIQGQYNSPESLIIKSTVNKWQEVFHGTVSGSRFSHDSRQVFIRFKDGNLIAQDLVKKNVDPLGFAKNFLLVGQSLIIERPGEEKSLELLHLKNLNNRKKISGVLQYKLSLDKTLLYFICSSAGGKNKLIRYTLSSGKTEELFNGDSINELQIDASGKNLAFTTKAGNDFKLWSINQDAKTATCYPENLSINSFSFSPDGRHLLLNLLAAEESNAKKSDDHDSTVLLFSFQDAKFAMDQAIDGMNFRQFPAALDIVSQKLIPLGKPGSQISSLNNSWAVVDFYKTSSSPSESNWSKSARMEQYLISLTNGKKNPLDFESISASALGKNHLLYTRGGDFYTYNLHSKIINNLSQHINTQWTEYDADRVERKFQNYFHEVRWVNDDNAIILPDRYDLWLISLDGQRKPINLTRGYGKKNQIILRPLLTKLSVSTDGFTTNLPEPFNPNQKQYLSGFNVRTKESGFYQYNPDSKSPKPLSVGNYSYQGLASWMELRAEGIKKSQNCNKYLLNIGAADKSYNLYTTSDFLHFKPLTDLHPEEQYNWLTSELHSWTSLNGDTLQGVLYKPKDFDPNKKYPVIFVIYEHWSNNLNTFQPPKLAAGGINVPWMVSRGYLVFRPDISYRNGDAMQSAYEAVESAASYIQKLPFVDAAHLGLQGHSFGGAEANYIATRSSKFAAICSAAGSSNLVSHYGTIGLVDGLPQAYKLEIAQYRMNSNPWDNPEGYRRNSPIENLDKISAPMLIMHGDKDAAVPVSQGHEMFIGLRRLGKPAWLLLYQGEGHIIDKLSNRLDYTRRMEEFFGHYLKGAPIPDWMNKDPKSALEIIPTKQRTDQIKTLPNKQH